MANFVIWGCANAKRHLRVRFVSFAKWVLKKNVEIMATRMGAPILVLIFFAKTGSPVFPDSANVLPPMLEPIATAVNRVILGRTVIRAKQTATHALMPPRAPSATTPNIYPMRIA